MLQILSKFDTGHPVDEVVCRYITNELNGVLTEERYGAPRGDVFTIYAPDGTSISKLTAGKKKLTLKWEKSTDVLEGYQIAYSTSKTFKSGVKTIHLGADKTTSTIKNLKAKKNYYVRIRTYSKLGNIIVYSGWSSIKNAKTK